MAKTRNFKTITEMVQEMGSITRTTEERFGHLSSAQVNWKPGPDRWSVGQCFDHLITTNKSYFPIFERVVKGEKRNTLWESMPILPGLFGGLLIRSLDPASTRKLKAPSAFAPASSEVDGEIIQKFSAQQERLSTALQGLEGADLDAVKITSPALKLITYSLRDACTIIVVHEQRHLQQATNVLALPEFPQT
jgi:DinB superfamily